MGLVEDAKITKHKRYVVGLVQHFANQGVNPVYVTARQLADLVGAKNWAKANEALVHLENTAHPDGLVTKVGRELVHHGKHTYLNRSFTLNEGWEGYISNMHDTYVSLSPELAETKRLRAEALKAKKAERERSYRLIDLRMRYISWAAQRDLSDLVASLRSGPKPDPFTAA